MTECKTNHQYTDLVRKWSYTHLLRTTDQIYD